MTGQKLFPSTPPFVESMFQQAVVLHQTGQFAQAQTLYENLLKIQPRHVGSLHLLGVLAHQGNKHQLAIELISKAIKINPKIAAPYSNIGLAFQALNRLDDALFNYNKAIALKLDYAEAYYNRGNVLKSLNRLKEALDSYDKAIALKPDYPSAYNNRGNTLKGLKRLEEALVNYDKAITLNPDYAEAYINRGAALQDLKRLEEALISYNNAISLKPDCAEAYNNRGNTLRELGHFDEALLSYNKAILLKPDYEFLLGVLLHTKMMVCDWKDLDASINNIEAEIRAFKKITQPFPALSLLDSPEIHRQASRIYVDTKFPETEQLGAIEKRPKGEKIRIGYYSADFHNHATAYLMAELFETHDTTKFEIIGFSFGPDKRDEMRDRVSAAFANFFDVQSKSDIEIARHSRELGIDIAIDLKGFTTDSRTEIFAARCAPIQVNYLGYPGTMGAGYMDYIVADTTLIPKESQSCYTEKVVYLPHSYQVNDSKRRISERVSTRHELGLPESGFVFCCFNNNYKILPSTFDVWMNVLRAVEGSILWLLEDHPTAVKNLQMEAESRGVDSSRIVFAKRMPLDEHLARHRLADLFLDTLPCNAHTTASDALWAGLPVLTCMGQSFASRVAASLLKAIELPELVTNSEAEYEAKAVELASNPEKLSELKHRLENNRLTTPLFNVKLFTKHIELAYEAMYDRYQSGLAPESIEVQARDQ